MLVSLAIGNVVLINRVELAFGPGLCVLTGETGAGKSILLDSLGLALGTRANAGLVRGASKGNSATVTATFLPNEQNAVHKLLSEQDLEVPEVGETIVLRRIVDSAGRSRAYVNDQAVSINLLRKIGDLLVEIEGQFATQGLLDSANHRSALDTFGSLQGKLQQVADSHAALRDARAALEAAEAQMAKAQEDEEFLRHAVEELRALAPQPDEETLLADTRALLMHGEKLVEAIKEADTALTSGGGVEDRLSTAIRSLARHTDTAQGRFDPILDSLERATDGVTDALTQLRRVMADTEPDPKRLDECEERLFALRAIARKHNVAVAELPALQARLQEMLAAVEDGGAALIALKRACDEAKTRYLANAEALSAKRKEAAKKLDRALALELPPLRLEKAVFTTVVEPRAEAEWGPNGIDHIHFEVSTVPGVPGGPLARVASGGELARFLLALKLVLHRANAVGTLIFDEVDSGVGGATASAIGERLARLAEDAQVLVITHSPQVAAYGAYHLRVAKTESGKDIVTTVEDLGQSERREEIARMLAGAEITDEARAAADSLMIAQHG
jgi:DNA repair protein RecN (Recombination protein N)